jgi:hypothetical protein
MLRGQNKNRQGWSLASSRSGYALASLLLMSTVAHGSADGAAVPVPPAGESPEQASRLTWAAPDFGSDRFIARGQTTYVWQRKYSFDYQRIVNPGYNADRHGPVHVVGGRIHVEF